MAAVAEQFRSFGFSVGVHLAALAVLVIGVDMTRQVIIAPASPPVIKGTAVDQRVLDKELARLKQIEQARAQAELERQQALEREAEAAREKRRAQERRKAEAREAQAARQAREQAELERKAEEERAREAAEATRLAEEERQRAEQEAAERREAELERQAEAAARLEEERRRALLAEEEAALVAAEQARRDESELARYLARVERSVMANFRIPGGDSSRSCTLYIKLIPGGDVAEVRIVTSSGSAAFDRQAELAVRKAAPLPVPDDLRLFNKLREIQFVFDPEG
ncbi:MAG: cell envelope integrity protein TolA [Gammaproteobacteria bacterium]|nr:cell envelope integrity protein TolA [Gammaproteobacteria bacterium]NNM01293.1 cell envelope integrity protein TolA [Gammaproteobacteria bacterium]